MPSDQYLIQIVDAALASAAQRSGPHLVCRPGCSPCCHGVFEITALDAARLRQAFQLLATTHPARHAAIAERLTHTQRHLAPWFPGNLEIGVLTGTPEAIELFEEFAAADPCPLLDPATQTCELYAARPILCRTFGPPIRNDHADPTAGLAICELCFTHATGTEITAAEMDSTFRPLEEQLDQDLRSADPTTGPTIVAFALLTNPPQP